MSLLVPVDRDAPWREHLRRLAEHAEERLRDGFGAGVDTALIARIHAAVAGVGDAPVGDTPRAADGARSIAVFVGADGANVVPLSVRVRERVVVDDTFATRDLVHAALRAPS